MICTVKSMLQERNEPSVVTGRKQGHEVLFRVSVLCDRDDKHFFFDIGMCKAAKRTIFLVPICQQGQNESFLVSVPVLVPVLVLIPAPVCQQGRSGSFLVSVS